MRQSFSCVSLALAMCVASAPALGQLPAGNPLPTTTIPTAPWSIVLEDVLTIPNSSGQFPRLEFLTTGGAPDLAYVIDQRGPIYTFDPAEANPSPTEFFNLATAVPNFLNGPQTGVRGLAFHPDFNNSGTDGYRTFYTSHSRTAFAPGVGNPVFFPSPPNLNHDSVVGEWKVDASGEIIASSYREVMRIGQPFADHNIGQIGFNPNTVPADDDYGNLYIALGDGGNNFPPIPIDPNNLAQDLDNPHGSLLRIDPLTDGGAPYSIPDDNPFRVSSSPGTSRNVIWAYGFRNPHRFTFDTGGDGKLLISDIGQANIEEINLGAAGANYGWDLREGTFQTTGSFSGSNNLVATLPAGHATDAFTYPVAQYDHDPDNNNNIEGLWAVVGGAVYRGSALPELTGMYIFGEFAENEGAIFAVDVDELVQHEDFTNLQDLHDGLLAPFVELPLVYNGQQKTLLEILRDTSGNQNLTRTDLRFGVGPDDELYVLNKRDGRVRRIAAVTGVLAGDYDGNGIVDAADYTVWRDALGQTLFRGTGADGDFSGGVDEGDYAVWADNFGSTSGSGAATLAAVVPEAAGWALWGWMVGVVVCLARSGR